MNLKVFFYLYEMTHIYIFNFNLQSKIYKLYGGVDVFVCYEFLLDAVRVFHCVHRIHHDPLHGGYGTIAYEHSRVIPQRFMPQNTYRAEHVLVVR